MKCSICHGEVDTGKNILEAHDELSGTTLAQDLEKGKRYKCSDCHQDVILGQQGKEGVEPLSQAIHGFHADKMAQSNLNPPCYSCHPGPVTLCNRGAMYKAGFLCGNTNCHGTMENIAQTQADGTRQAWVQQPDCGGCHGVRYNANPNKLYKDSFLQNGPSPSMNNIILCAACHNSPHAEWVSTLEQDNLLPISLMGYAGYIDQCSVCHQGSGKIHRGTAREE
jgi:hypothetical protein